VVLTSLHREALFQDDNNLYIMMEFVQGGEMFSHLRKQEKFDEDVAKFYAVEVAVALNKLHLLGIAYRDLKPENIMIGRCSISLHQSSYAKPLRLRSIWTCATSGFWIC
jgi:serine/threonine protein kinase